MDLNDYLVIRLVTSLGIPKAKTFIDPPADPEFLEVISQHLARIAAGEPF